MERYRREAKKVTEAVRKEKMEDIGGITMTSERGRHNTFKLLIHLYIDGYITSISRNAISPQWTITSETRSHFCLF